MLISAKALAASCARPCNFPSHSSMVRRNGNPPPLIQGSFCTLHIRKRCRIPSSLFTNLVAMLPDPVQHALLTTEASFFRPSFLPTPRKPSFLDTARPLAATAFAHHGCVQCYFDHRPGSGTPSRLLCRVRLPHLSSWSDREMPWDDLVR
jgi:hypothetical protein